MKRKRDLHFSNAVIDKKQLKHIIVWAFRNYGIARAANMADKLKDLGFYYATKAGISLGLEDLRIPPVKKTLLKRTLNLIIDTDNKYQRGAITTVERFQKVIDTWNNASDRLKKEVIEHFKNTDPLNSIYMMAFSGARGNISQVRQLVGMRGLMSDPQGQIIDLPISSNFREGLTVTDYFISSYGARKGLVDIALRTADSGYLTRRLVDVAQDVIVREVDCRTTRGILLEDITDNGRVLVRLEQLLIGRLLAEDLLHPATNTVIACAGQDIDDLLAEKIVKAGIAKVLVRSPITCDATSSVCQKCYGWNLAHGRLVDLGEAIGIIAAQSIGEPGTQLTMRTFHTGGVFTGEFADKIYSPFDAIIRHPDTSLLIATRTRYGERAYSVAKECSIILYSLNDRSQKKISLIKGALILVDNSSKVLKNQLLIEYPLRSRLTTEKAQKVMTSDISGRISFSDLIVAKAENKQQVVKSSQSGGLIWVLAGQVHSVSNDANFVVREGVEVNPGDLLAVRKIASSYSGYVQILNQGRAEDAQEVMIIVASRILTNITLSFDKYSGLYSYFLIMDNQDKFLLNVKPGDKIVDGQLIGELVSDIYRTSTGGIIKYLDLQVSKDAGDLGNECCTILGSGYVLWVPEETYELNKDLSLILVEHGDFIDKGTEVIKNIFAQNAGIVEIVEKDGIVREVIIKPCATYRLVGDELSHHRIKKRGFLRPGEKIIGNISTNKLVYWECLKLERRHVLLIRPVIVYSIPNKVCVFKYGPDSFRPDLISLTLIRRISFKDGTRVKSAQSVDLIKTYLAIGFSRKLSGLTYFADFNHRDTFSMALKFTAVNRVLIKYNKSISQNNQLISTTRIKVSNYAFIYKSQTIAQTETLSNVAGQVTDLQSSHSSNRRFVILTSSDRYIYKFNKSHALKIRLGSWVLKGQEITQGFYSPESGQIISISSDNATLRCARPYLVPGGSILHVDDDSLIQRGESIATLIFNRVKTGDIVQGLPRIEEILEARKKIDNDFNPHTILEKKFRFYLDSGLSLHDSTRVSFQEIQLVLVKEVQLVYQSQGVDISDKHIEVIVRQMTSKVKIEQGGDTNYLPGEMVDLRKIESVNKTISLVNMQTATYYPILLGITKASLNTESFISAASFQETTKVLTEAAILGKLDWLRGLKENVIIGRLIPAGTGFNSCNAVASKNSVDYRSNIANLSSVAINSTESSFEDIILDDRAARNLINSRHQLNDLQPNQDIY